MIVIYLINKISDFLLVKLILCFEKVRVYCSGNKS